jgi:hypothetical protein
MLSMSPDPRLLCVKPYMRPKSETELWAAAQRIVGLQAVFDARRRMLYEPKGQGGMRGQQAIVNDMRNAARSCVSALTSSAAAGSQSSDVGAAGASAGAGVRGLSSVVLAGASSLASDLGAAVGSQSSVVGAAAPAPAPAEDDEAVSTPLDMLPTAALVPVPPRLSEDEI